MREAGKHKENIMSSVIHVPDDGLTVKQNTKDEFKNDILAGLTLPNKQIQSKYFYDDRGSELFNQITRHPDYYLTRCELDILNRYKQQLSSMISAQAFNLVELGPGEGLKTQILIEQFLKDSLDFTYMPIDISSQYLLSLVRQFKQQLPALKHTPIHADYFKGLEWLSDHSKRRNLVLFLGSSIGNFDWASANAFLSHLHESLHAGDYILIGFDLRKDIGILMRAYNDIDGITRDFNLNLLTRMNRELSANFDETKFSHYATYNVYSGAMESYLISLQDQSIHMDALQKTFHFHAYEAMHVEFSCKYLLSQIEEMATANGFEIVNHFKDTQHYFVDSLWRVR